MTERWKEQYVTDVSLLNVLLEVHYKYFNQKSRPRGEKDGSKRH